MPTSLREDIVALFPQRRQSFRAAARTLFEERDGVGRGVDALDADVAAFAGPEGFDGFGALDERERELVWRVWLFDETPLGLTLSGPAYQDNPILYANRSFRQLTGYSLDALRGENPRLLQGEETEADALDDLREALDIWEPVTVQVTNYTSGGEPFTNRVSLVPLPDETGTISQWLGVQAAVD